MNKKQLTVLAKEAAQDLNSEKDGKTDDVKLDINTPSDRQREFGPQIIKERETRTPAISRKA